MRLIDADELPITSVGICDAMGNNYGCADVVFADDVKNAPTVDAEPVRRGKWIEIEDDVTFDTMYKCSECGEEYMLIDGTPAQNLYNYCPNCGAKMQEGSENG